MRTSLWVFTICSFLLVGCSSRKSPLWVWQATYCPTQDCSQKDKEIVRNQDIYEGQPIGCPLRIWEQDGFIPNSLTLPQVYKTYFFKPGTCEIFAYELFHTPGTAPPERIHK